MWFEPFFKFSTYFEIWWLLLVRFVVAYLKLKPNSIYLHIPYWNRWTTKSSPSEAVSYCTEFSFGCPTTPVVGSYGVCKWGSVSVSGMRQQVFKCEYNWWHHKKRQKYEEIYCLQKEFFLIESIHFLNKNNYLQKHMIRQERLTFGFNLLKQTINEKITTIGKTIASIKRFTFWLSLLIAQNSSWNHLSIFR